MSSVERAQYDREGYTIYRNVLDADLVAEASDHVVWLLQKTRTCARSSCTTT
jgi:flavin-dependent dehydrogenase